jgi:hypothetical protein
VKSIERVQKKELTTSSVAIVAYLLYSRPLPLSCPLFQEKERERERERERADRRFINLLSPCSFPLGAVAVSSEIKIRRYHRHADAAGQDKVCFGSVHPFLC